MPDVKLETEDIRMIMISEVVPENPQDYFYTGVSVNTIDDIVGKGLYITTTSKIPKEGYIIPTEIIKKSSLFVE